MSAAVCACAPEGEVLSLTPETQHPFNDRGGTVDLSQQWASGNCAPGST